MPLVDVKLDIDPEVLGKLASGESKLWTAVVRNSAGAISDHIPIVESGLNAAENMLSNNLANAALSQAQANGFWSNAWGFVKQHKWGFIIGSALTAGGGSYAAYKHHKNKKARREQEERERLARIAQQERERKEQQEREREMGEIYSFCNELSILLISYIYQAEKGEIDKAALGQLIKKLEKAHELNVSGKLTVQDHETLISLRDSITALTEKLIEEKKPELMIEEETETENLDDFFFIQKQLQRQYMVIEDLED